MARRRLSIDAELQLRRGETTFDVWTEHDLVVCNAPSLSALRKLRSVQQALPPWLLDGGGLTDEPPPMELRVRHAPVARLGPAVDGTPGVERLTGFDASVDPRGLLAAAVRALG